MRGQVPSSPVVVDGEALEDVEEDGTDGPEHGIHHVDPPCDLYRSLADDEDATVEEEERELDTAKTYTGKDRGDPDCLARFQTL